MLSRLFLALAIVLGMIGSTSAADLARVARTIDKEPAYRTKSRGYLLLVFGSEAADRVWLVRDGETLYVDRNGNGDLTEPGEAVPARKRDGGDPDSEGRRFEAGDLTLNGIVHKSLVVHIKPLAGMNEEIRERADAKARLRANAKAEVAVLTLEVRSSKWKGTGVDGRVNILAGPMDLGGLLEFAASPRSAPIIHPDGPLEITFYASRPIFQLGRQIDAVLVVGSPGLGSGSLAMLAYDGTIPATANPVLEIFYSSRPDAAPFREQFELKERC